jgi:hypothetical protein
MPNRRYEWKRFWLPRSEAIIPLSDGGFFPDPDSEAGKWLIPEAITFESINHYPCLVLLGEPGIGKSTALDAARRYQVDAIAEGSENMEILDLDLRSYGEEDRLIRDLFESEKFKTWLSGSDILAIFLDSYDECLLQLKKLGQLLADKLKEYKSQICRLHLRIACRTAVWPSYLEDELKNLYGEEDLGIFQLAPLRRVDVVVAAAAETSFDSDSFINAVRHKDVISFAIKPITLRFLLSSYRNHGSLDNTTKVDLYLNGCICLCEESNGSRLASSQQGKLNKHKRLIIAAQIAAISIFSNRAAVWSGIHQIDTLMQDFSINSISGRCESHNDNQFDVLDEGIKETLDTGLFSTRGENRLGWAHQSYAEFLAAWYIEHHKTPINEISELIFSKDQQNRRLIPQLQQTAAWLGSMRQEIFDIIARSDPAALLTSDIENREQNAKLLVDRLLSDFNQGNIHDYYKYTDNYRHLQHAGLADQLRPYLNPKKSRCNAPFAKKNVSHTKSDEARHAAILISHKCSIKEVQQDLVDMAFNTNEDSHLRSAAAHAISDYGEEIYRQMLKPLALNAGPDDSYDELKGYSLAATWPNYISATEVFAHLTKPNRLNFIGSYKIFIYSKLAPHLKRSDLPVALDWLKHQGERDCSDFFKELGDQIIFKASNYLDQSDILRLLADVALNQWKGHHCFAPITSNQQTQRAFPWLENDIIRRDLLSQVVYLACERQSQPDAYCIYRDIAKSIDFDWILGKLNDSKSHSIAENEMWTSLLRYAFDIANPNHVDAVLTSSQTSRILRAVFKSLLEPIDLNSDEANRLKKLYNYEQDIRESPKLTQIKVPLDQQINELLNAIEAGSPDAFWVLLTRLSPRPGNAYDSYSLVELDIRKLPGWLTANQEVQARIVNAASLYLRACDQRSRNLIISDQFSLPFMAGCKALYLLMQIDQAQISELSADCWRKWAAAVVSYPNVGSQDAAYTLLVQLAYQNAPTETIFALENMLELAKKDEKPIELTRFANSWDARLNTLIFNQLIDQPEYSKYHESLLENLIERREAKAVELALALIKQPITKNNVDSSKDRLKVKIATRILLENSDSMIWPAVWQIIESDQELGREIIEDISPLWLRKPHFDLAETQLADFYLWLTRQYPEIDRSNNDDFYIYQIADHIEDLRRCILTILQQRGTPLACQEILRLSQALPELPWLKTVHVDARNVMLRTTWLPLEPRELLELITKHQIKAMEHKGDTKHVNNTNNIDKINVTGDGNTINITSGGQNSSKSKSIGKDKPWQFWLGLLGFIIALLGTAAGIAQVFISIYPNKVESFLNGEIAPKSEQAKPSKLNR